MSLSLGLSFGAGLLTTISPCVLPILPMLLGSSVQKKKSSPAFMVLGLMLSFTGTGLLLSRFGNVLGLNTEQLRVTAAALLIVGGISFFSKRLQDAITKGLTKFANIGNSNAAKIDDGKPWGALLTGGLLGIIWSPCVGPALGVAITLAGQETEFQKALMMILTYSLGAGLPMLLIAYGSRSAALKISPNFMSAAKQVKTIFGIILIFTGISIIFGMDKAVETALLESLPEYWIDAITKI